MRDRRTFLFVWITVAFAFAGGYLLGKSRAPLPTPCPTWTEPAPCPEPTPCPECPEPSPAVACRFTAEDVRHANLRGANEYYPEGYGDAQKCAAVYQVKIPGTCRREDLR